MPVVEATEATARPLGPPHPLPRKVAGISVPLLAAVVAVVAFAARAGLLLRGGGLGSGGEYDDGVYYAAADALVHGRIPYRDFLLLHPPGIALAVAPFAWLGSLTSDSLGFAAARVGFELLGAANAVIVTLLLRRRGLLAAAVGGLTYAIFYPAVYAERSTLLEPLGTLGTLLGLLALLHRPMRARWAALAGVALGATLGVKIWYVIPSGIAVLIALRVLRRHQRWALLGGGAAAAGVLYLPFFLLAPGRMWRYVVTDQLGRPGSRSLQEMPVRVHSILGIPHVPGVSGDTSVTQAVLTAVVGAAVLLVVALTVVKARDLEVVLYVALLVSGGVVLLASPSFFQHYSTLTAAPIALLVGAAVGELVKKVRLPAAAGIAAAVVAAVAALEYPLDTAAVGNPPPGSALQNAAARVSGCIMADDPTMLAVTNTLSRNLDRGCPLWPDVTGYTYEARYMSVRNGTLLTRPRNPRWQALVLRYLTSGDAVMTSRPSTGLSPRSERVLARGRVLARSHGVVLRVTPPQAG